VIAVPEPPHLRAVPTPNGESLEGEGLTLAYAALERVRAERGLHRLAVAVEDPRLGRQLFVAPRMELADHVEPGAAWSMDPPSEPGADLELAAALCAVVLRASDREVGTLAPLDALELELRRLSGVQAVAVDAEHDLVRIQLAPGHGGGDVAPAAGGLVKARLARNVVVEVVGAPGAAGPVTGPTPISWAPTPPLELIALREDAETSELEVHLRGGEVRTVGRAPRTDGPVGAAEATLAAWRDRPGALPRAVAWARTVERTADGRCVVAVALEDPGHVTVAHGIGTGRSPIDATVLATIDALSR
jgi:hypothetical protein